MTKTRETDNVSIVCFWFHEPAETWGKNPASTVGKGLQLTWLKH